MIQGLRNLPLVAVAFSCCAALFGTNPAAAKERSQPAPQWAVDAATFLSWTITGAGRQFQAMETDFVDRGAYGDAVMQFTERIRTVNPPPAIPAPS
jgi:hypothetical protein